MHELQKSTGLTNEFLSDNAESPLVMSKDNLSYWHGHFKGWEKSGLSQAAYCRRNDLKYCLFHYWKRKLNKPSQSSVQLESNTINFVEVSSPRSFISRQSSQAAPIDFFRLWVGDICIEVGNKFDGQSLSQLLGCLRAL